MHCEVAKLYSEPVALTLLYTVIPITKFLKKVESGLFSQSGSYGLGCQLLTSAALGIQ